MLAHLTIEPWQDCHSIRKKSKAFQTGQICVKVHWMRRILSDPILKYSNHSAGIFSFVDARGNDKRSSMRGSQLRAGPRAFSRSGKRGTAHHRGLVSLRISDGKFVNHTTEMIL